MRLGRRLLRETMEHGDAEPDGKMLVFVVLITQLLELEDPKDRIRTTSPGREDAVTMRRRMPRGF